MKLNGKKIAKIVSYLLTPPTFTAIIFYVVAKREHTNFSFIFGNAMMFGVVLPISVFVFMRKKQMIADDDATKKEERTLPYLIGAGLTLIALILNTYELGFNTSSKLWLVYLLSSLLIAAINKYWKISAHSMAASIALGTALALENEYSLFFLFAVMIVFWARLRLKVHTPMQVLTGALVGSIISILIISM